MPIKILSIKVINILFISGTNITMKYITKEIIINGTLCFKYTCISNSFHTVNSAQSVPTAAPIDINFGIKIKFIITFINAPRKTEIIYILSFLLGIRY